MTAFELLSEFSARGVRIVVRGDRLSLRGPENVLTQSLTHRLRERKPEILEAARCCPTCCDCGAVIGPDEPETWWGLDRVHLDCGEAAWRRVWRGESLPADAEVAEQ